MKYNRNFGICVKDKSEVELVSDNQIYRNKSHLCDDYELCARVQGEFCKYIQFI